MNPFEHLINTPLIDFVVHREEVIVADKKPVKSSRNKATSTTSFEAQLKAKMASDDEDKQLGDIVTQEDGESQKPETALFEDCDENDSTPLEESLIEAPATNNTNVSPSDMSPIETQATSVTDVTLLDDSLSEAKATSDQPIVDNLLEN